MTNNDAGTETQQQITASTERLGPCQERIHVKLSPERVDKVFNEIEKTVQQQASIPGFRPGKTPTSLLYSRFGDRIKSDAKRRLLQDTLEEAVEQQELKAEHTSLDDESVTPEKGEPFEFSATLEVQPEFELPQYKGIELPQSENEVTDQQVEDFIQQLLQSRASYETVNRPAQEGDLVKINYKAATEGQDIEVPEASNFLLEAQELWAALQDPETLPGITEVLKGTEAGQTVDANITFPEDFREPSLANLTLPYHFEILEVQSETVPELTEDFAQEVGFDTVEDIRSRVRENLQQSQEQQQQQERESQIVQKLLLAEDFDLPSTILERQIEHTLNQIKQQRQQQGESEEDLNQKEDELRQEAEEQAHRILKEHYIIERIAEAEGLTVEQQELQSVIENVSQQQNISWQDAAEQLRDSGRLGQIIESMRRSKVIQMILENAKIAGSDEGEEQASSEEAADSQQGSGDEAEQASKASTGEEEQGKSEN